MQLTDVRIRKVEKEGKMKAVDGDFRDIAHPINSATRDQIQGLILKKYEEVLQEKE